MPPSKESDRIKAAAEAFSGGLNCAQAIATAFQDVYNIAPAKIEAHKRSGGGRAPGGTCGALHAALDLIEDAAQRETLSTRFADIAGNTHCRAIRKEKRISCAGCVEAAAVLLDEVVKAQHGATPATSAISQTDGAD